MNDLPIEQKSKWIQLFSIYKLRITPLHAQAKKAYKRIKCYESIWVSVLWMIDSYNELECFFICVSSTGTN